MFHSVVDIRDESAPPSNEGENDARVLAWPARTAICLIGLYQRYVSPYTPPSCRFYPTCSCYTREAIARFGLLRGGALGVWRVLRCNPMCKGGDDAVPLKNVKLQTASRETKAAAPDSEKAPPSEAR